MVCVRNVFAAVRGSCDNSLISSFLAVCTFIPADLLETILHRLDLSGPENAGPAWSVGAFATSTRCIKGSHGHAAVRVVAFGADGITFRALYVIDAPGNVTSGRAGRR
jgi:hypothetical protein